MTAEHLQPFEKGSERAREAGRKGGLTRARNAAAKRANETADSEGITAALQRIAESFNRDDISQNAAAVTNMLLGQIAAGSIEVSGRDVAGLLDVLVSIVRLEEGKATSHHAVVNTEQVLARIEQLRQEAGGETATQVVEQPAVSGEIPRSAE